MRTCESEIAHLNIFVQALENTNESAKSLQLWQNCGKQQFFRLLYGNCDMEFLLVAYCNLLVVRFMAVVMQL
jgi:hypothetical protein